MTKIFYNGIQFDSEYELKYALSIEDDHCYIHHPNTTYNAPTFNGIKQVDKNTQSYTPDFLVRHIQTRKASLIEVKGSSNADREKRTRLAEGFIRNQNKDYNFDWIKASFLKLSPEKEIMFNTIIKNQKEHRRFHEKLKQWHKAHLPYYNPFQLATGEYERFTRYGDEVFITI